MLPEDKLEALLISGNDKTVYNNLLSMPSGISEKREKYLYSKSPQRNIKLTQELQSIYSGRCQVCKWDPKNKYGHSLCEAHHIRWLSRGGPDELSNLLLVCPNHHRAIHNTDAAFDYETFTLNFDNHLEELKLNSHL